MEKGKVVGVGGSTPMVMVGSRGAEEDEEDTPNSIRTAETVFRLIPVALCIAALLLMIKDSQTNDFGSLSYSDLTAFRYLVHANGICAGYSLVSAVIVAMPRSSTISRAWILFFFDQVLTYVILGAAAVSVEVLYLARKGDTAITWSAACVSFGGFCHKATASAIITFGVVACYVLLSLLSSYKLFTRFDAPADTYPTKAAQTPAFHG
ncbi:CASP-like protein 2A1 [Euphorbia peplus]|nr:CASP-like protein 2A1 [Euphorbia peplus]